MKDLHCSDSGTRCDFVARGNTNEEILKKAAEHAQKAHNMAITPELTRKMESLIHDETSDAHRRSTQRT